MKSDELRQLIREAIVQELGQDASQHPLAHEPLEEIVSIESDAELAGFVHRLLEMADDPKRRADIRAGRLQFKLAGGARDQRPEVQQVRLAPRFVTERQVDALPEGTTVVTVGKGTRLTPLARDRLRAKNIKIERAVT